MSLRNSLLVCTRGVRNRSDSPVKEVFSSVASKYDVMNDLMSLAIHRQWKAHFVSQIAPPPGCKILDVAGGTGLSRLVLYLRVNDQVILHSDCWIIQGNNTLDWTYP